MQQYLQNKKGLVQGVFDKVFDKYDLMNDFMSFGIHRIWKSDLMFWMNPGTNKILLDVACGTGDLAKLFHDKTKNLNNAICIDPNEGMINIGKKKLRKYKNIDLIDVFNMSINNTLSRTVMTSITTLLALISLYLFGGEVIKPFALTMIIGVLVGTYSSIFIAVPTLLVFKFRPQDEDEN